MKHFMAIVCSFVVFTAFGQEEMTKNSKWGGEFTVGLGIAELQNENFDISGNINNFSFLLFYKATPKIRLLTGISFTYFTNAALLSDGYSNLKASVAEIPLKCRGQIWKPTQSNIKLMFGAGLQAHKVYAYQQKINDKVFETSNTDWSVSLPVEIGMEFPFGEENSLGIYLQSSYDLGNKSKKYILRSYDLLKLSLSVNF